MNLALLAIGAGVVTVIVVFVINAPKNKKYDFGDAKEYKFKTKKPSNEITRLK